MELNPHDLLKIRNGRDLADYRVQPDWAREVLERGPFVVVCRRAFINELVSVGIRGDMRSQRFASLIHPKHIVQRIIPEELAVNKIWRKNPRLLEMRVFQALDRVDEIFTAKNLSWGPTGSVGFELASGIPTVKDTSDLDMIIRTSHVLSVDIGRQLVEELGQLGIPMDVQIETPYGGVSLLEYARGDRPVILRTRQGPKLVADPWKDEKNLER